MEKRSVSKLIKKLKQNTIAKNSLIIMSGQMIVSGIAMINMMLLLLNIGSYGNGILTIVISYSTIFNGIFNFQSYNAIIKFGADALCQNNQYKFKQYLKQAFFQDAITAVLAFSIGAICVPMIGKFMHWDQSIMIYIYIYLCTIPFNITGSINGFLRLNNEFKVGAIIGIRIVLMKLFLLLLGMVMKYPLIYYIAVETILVITSNSMLALKAYKKMKLMGCEDFLKVKIHFDREFTKFNFYNNIVSTIDMPTGQLVNMFINKLLGVNEVGIYNIFAKFGSLLTMVTMPITDALFPELSKMVVKRNITEAYNLVKKIFLYVCAAGSIGIAGVIITQRLWLHIFIPSTTENVIAFTLFLSYITIASATGGIHVFFVAMNLVRHNLIIVSICNIIYIILFYILTIKIGLIGVAAALLMQVMMMVIIKYIILNRVTYTGRTLI